MLFMYGYSNRSCPNVRHPKIRGHRLSTVLASRYGKICSYALASGNERHWFLAHPERGIETLSVPEAQEALVQLGPKEGLVEAVGAIKTGKQ